MLSSHSRRARCRAAASAEAQAGAPSAAAAAHSSAGLAPHTRQGQRSGPRARRPAQESTPSRHCRLCYRAQAGAQCARQVLPCSQKTIRKRRAACRAAARPAGCGTKTWWCCRCYHCGDRRRPDSDQSAQVATTTGTCSDAPAQNVAHRMPREAPHCCFVRAAHLRLRPLVTNHPEQDGPVVPAADEELLVVGVPRDGGHVTVVPVKRGKLAQHADVKHLHGLVTRRRQ